MKRTISSILIAATLFAFFPLSLFQTLATTSYNPDAAIAYAAAHATDTPEIAGADCANFVSKCVTAGGINVSEKVCINLMLALKPYAATITNLEIKMSNGYGRVPTSGSNANILSKGDVMFVCCERCKATGNNYERHAVIYSGESDSNGYAKCYAHTSMANNTTFWVGYNGTYACSNGHSTTYLTAEVVHFESTTQVVPEKPTITNKSSYYAEGSNALISWNAVGGNAYYWINVWKDDELIVNQTTDNITNYTLHNLSKGKYTFIVSANNSAGTSEGSSFSFLVGMAPEKTELSINQNSYTVGDTIIASWKAVAGTSYYWINVYKNETLIVNQSMDTITSYTFENAELGEYRIVVSANNDAGNAGGSSVSFSVLPLSAPEIPTSNSFYKTNQTIEISWNSISNAVSYVYYLSEYPEEYAYTTNVSSGTVASPKVSFSNLPNGRYSMFVCSISESGKVSAQSNWITFYVYNDDYVPNETIEHNGHLYALFDVETSWDFAKILCTEMGGHLATITSEQENTLITELIGRGKSDSYWLGASNVLAGNYNAIGQHFAWVTNEPFEYTNWKSGEPSQSGEEANIEHFLEIRKSYNNKWNDVANTNRNNKGFILEIDTSNYVPVATSFYGESKYLLFDESIPWSVAQIYCESIGGHLVSVSSNAEDDAINTLVQQGEKPWYYIGASKLTGEWQWLDNSLLSEGYSNWSTINSWGNYLMKYRATGDWIGINNFYAPGSDMKQMGFVCEIDNAVFTISYDTNGGYGEPEDQTKYPDTTLILSLTKPTRPGYTFLGWSTSSTATNATYKPGGLFTQNANTTLYAVWAKGCENASHNYSIFVTEPSCTDKGYTTHTCSECGHNYVDSYVNELGHTEGSEATCSEDQVCTVCRNTLVKALGHIKSEWVTLDDGSQEIRCIICNELLAFVSAPVPEDSINGDINNDRAINQYDYILVKRHYFNTRPLTQDESTRADVNCDGVINQYDYIIIKRHYFGTFIIG